MNFNDNKDKMALIGLAVLGIAIVNVNTTHWFTNADAATATASLPSVIAKGGTLSSGGADYTVVSESKSNLLTIGDVSPDGTASLVNGPTSEIILRVRVTNNGDSPITFNDSNFHLARNGKTFESSSIVYDDINPGLSDTPELDFRVPNAGSLSDYTLEVQVDASGDTREIRL